MLWSWILLSCNSESPPLPDAADAHRYAALVSLTDPDPDQHFADCQALSGPDLRGDCSLVIARKAAKSRGEPPETYCDRLAEVSGSGDLWQDECYFMAAEDYNKRKDAGRAAAMCLQARAFADHCSQHLWQQGLRSLTWHTGSAAFPEHLDDAQQIYAQWAPHLAEGTDFDVRFWRRFYEGGFERDRHINMRACVGLPTQTDQKRCRDAGATLYERKLREVAHIHHPMALLCSLPPSAKRLSETGVPEFQTTGGPELDAILTRTHAERCRDGQPIVAERMLLAPGFDKP